MTTAARAAIIQIRELCEETETPEVSPTLCIPRSGFLSAVSGSLVSGVERRSLGANLLGSGERRDAQGVVIRLDQDWWR